MTSTILILNMTCGGCAKGVLASVAAAAPAARAEPDVASRSVVVTGVADPAGLVAALRADGWNATLAG
ncbi:MAG: heavy-metal-associated domain-containing protein [Acetobacteraceae bacterium]|nr:heavy-metal-associated domain-containing protein [Acetobacteraceae bacterium]